MEWWLVNSSQQERWSQGCGVSVWPFRHCVCTGRTGLKGCVNLSNKEGRKSESLSKLEDEFTGGKCYFKMGISGAEQNGLAAS